MMAHSKITRSLICWGLLIPVVIVTLFPYAVMLTTALKPETEVFNFPPQWLPSSPRWANFVEMWEVTGFGRALINSVIVSLATTALVVILGVPSAYALASLPMPGKGLYRHFLLVTQMLAPIVLVIGLFRLAAALGLVDSLGGLVIFYVVFYLAFAVWMMQNYFATIPRDLEEAAWVEGASRAASLRRVFLPMAVPAIAVSAIFTFINSWNEFILAFVMLRQSENFTLTLKVYSLVGGRYTVEWHYVMAAAFAATIPIAILFAWIQKFLVSGLSVGGVK